MNQNLLAHGIIMGLILRFNEAGAETPRKMDGIAVMKKQFQSTPPRGGRHTTSTSLMVLDCFNPRPRAGGDPYLSWF
jgi:hypothetical protein